MFEILFKYPAVLARYRAAPHSESRERFLNECAIQGYSDSMLRKIAWILLAVAPGINIDRGEVSLQDIKLAVDQRTRFRRQSRQLSLFPPDVYSHRHPMGAKPRLSCKRPKSRATFYSATRCFCPVFA